MHRPSHFFPAILFLLLLIPLALIYRRGSGASLSQIYEANLAPNLNTLNFMEDKEKKFVDMIPGSKWIVVTTIQKPTEDVKRLAAQKGWNLVVVADEKTPIDWKYPNVHFLSLENQSAIDTLADMLPRNSYTRKNMGYLYAIMHGAEWIYDTDDDNKPYGQGLDQFDYSSRISGLRYITKSKNMSEKLFNPYQFFGYKNMWPRGFPLEYLHGHQNGKEQMVLCRQMKPAAVQQGIVHNDPDVDAIFRLLHADRKTGLKAEFNSAAPPIILEEGIYSPWNSQNTLFHHKAFFTMFLPTTVAFRVTDIWRSYFAQKLLHLIGEQVAFYPVNAVQFRNSHNYLNDFNEEIDVYSKSGKIVEFLDKWNCTANSTADCVLELAAEFVSHQFFEEEDRNLIGMWIELLKSIGYEFPVLIEGTFARMRQRFDEKYGNCRGANLDFGEVQYDSTRNATDLTWAQNAVNHFGELLTWCSKSQRPFEKFLPTAKDFQERYENMKSLFKKKDTVLVLLNNYAWTSSIGLLQRMYSPFFKTVVFCGTWEPFNLVDLPMIEPVNFINITRDEMKKGFFYSYCTSKVRDLRLQNVSGYYFVADDSIFNIWYDLPLDKVVHPKNISMDPANWWEPWTARKAVTLFDEKYKDDEAIQKTWRKYEERVKSKGINQTIQSYMKRMTGKFVSDFVYVPTFELDFFADMFEILTEAGVTVEIAYAKVFNALEWDRAGANFTYLWGGRRYQKFHLYEKDKLGMHPIKTATALWEMHERRGFCNTVVKAFATEVYGQHNSTL